MKLVENKLQGTNITFKKFRTQWDDWFPHLEKYDYYKNITYRGGYASKLSRQIQEQINKIDSGKYETENFNLDSSVEFKEEHLDNAKKTRKIYTDEKRNKHTIMIGIFFNPPHSSLRETKFPKQSLEMILPRPSGSQ